MFHNAHKLSVSWHRINRHFKLNLSHRCHLRGSIYLRRGWYPHGCARPHWLLFMHIVQSDLQILTVRNHYNENSSFTRSRTLNTIWNISHDPEHNEGHTSHTVCEAPSYSLWGLPRVDWENTRTLANGVKTFVGVVLEVFFQKMERSLPYKIFNFYFKKSNIYFS